jgi:uncharacterized C2H2 Zn-finger protein
MTNKKYGNPVALRKYRELKCPYCQESFRSITNYVNHIAKCQKWYTEKQK